MSQTDRRTNNIRQQYCTMNICASHSKNDTIVNRQIKSNGYDSNITVINIMTLINWTLDSSTAYYLLLSSSCITHIFFTITVSKTGVFIRCIPGLDSRICCGNIQNKLQKLLAGAKQTDETKQLQSVLITAACLVSRTWHCDYITLNLCSFYVSLRILSVMHTYKYWARINETPTYRKH